MTIDVNRFDRSYTEIKIGCYRETYRLDRVLRTFHKIMTIADKSGRLDQICSCLGGLADCKGQLVVKWKTDIISGSLAEIVETAWMDENEYEIEHVRANGEIAFSGLISERASQ